MNLDTPRPGDLTQLLRLADRLVLVYPTDETRTIYEVAIDATNLIDQHIIVVKKSETSTVSGWSRINNAPLQCTLADIDATIDRSINPNLSAQGNRLSITRGDAIDSPAFDFDRYATTVAGALHKARLSDAVSFAILGPWGTGKTYLSQLVETQIGSYGIDTVRFSAWKYKTQHETWCHLYEVILAQARKSCRGFDIRRAVVQTGLLPLLFTCLMFTCANAPVHIKTATFEWLTALSAPLLSLTSLYLFYVLGKGILNLRRKYSDAPNHTDKLGLQHAIGEDLRLLFSGWFLHAEPLTDPHARSLINSNRDTDTLQVKDTGRCRLFKWDHSQLSKLMKMSDCVTGLCCTTLFILAVTFSLYRISLAILLPFYTTNPETTRLLEADFPARTSWAFFSALMLFTLLSFLILLLRPPRVNGMLLIIDDLDRCNSEIMLSTIEALQLLLQDNHYKKRLIIMFIAEEASLQAAIETKYRLNTAESTADRPAISRPCVWQDHMEKLFLFWFRLHALHTDHRLSFFNRVCNELLPVTVPTPPAAGGFANQVDDKKTPATTLGIPQLQPPPRPLLLPSEADTMKTEFANLVEGGAAVGLTQRAIRCLFWRYLLARELLQSVGVDAATSQLAKQLLDTSVRQKEQCPPPIPNNVIESVIRSVI